LTAELVCGYSKVTRNWFGAFGLTANASLVAHTTGEHQLLNYDVRICLLLFVVALWFLFVAVS